MTLELASPNAQRAIETASDLLMTAFGLRVRGLIYAADAAKCTRDAVGLIFTAAVTEALSQISAAFEEERGRR